MLVKFSTIGSHSLCLLLSPFPATILQTHVRIAQNNLRPHCPGQEALQPWQMPRFVHKVSAANRQRQLAWSGAGTATVYSLKRSTKFSILILALLIFIVCLAIWRKCSLKSHVPVPVSTSSTWTSIKLVWGLDAPRYIGYAPPPSNALEIGSIRYALVKVCL